ncbi:hypothetical protein P7K49_029061, partial [Saguinus oedipus]
SRCGGLSGCTVWGPHASLWPPRAAVACGRRRLGRVACGPSAPGRCAVARPPRRLGPSPAQLPGRRRGGLRGAPAPPGPGSRGSQKVSSLQVSINEGSNELLVAFAPFALPERCGEVGSEDEAFLRSPDLPAALFDFQRAAEASLTC